MSFQQFNGYGGQAHREHEKVVVYLSPKQPVPDMVPYELNDHIFPDDWHIRIMAIRDTTFNYYKPLFERIFFIVATISVVVLPFALYQIILNAMDNNRRPRSLEQFFQARAISFAISIGTFLLFAIPMLVWKGIGKRRVRSMLTRWEKADRERKGPSSFVPLWEVKTPTVFKSTCVVTITIPPSAHPTVFHPNAYLPPFINPPADGGAAYYYPYAPGHVGLPRMSVAGMLPAYKAEAGKERYFEDTKLAV
ncbi:hypothetical protein EW145_g5697 [Phellinidium pouzarii]|uniref:Uncharacterized protein n=1 Tax=Phellinidium pouzarii TaxID=167371 RepID=A0A4S4KZ90_9AGAM|nr:hypothetical protein EW145_g5697 [Phellinidium pouzarii]